MKRMLVALAIASVSVAAVAGPPVPSVNINNVPLPVDVVTSDVVPLTRIGPHIRQICDATAAQCELLVSLEQPVALYEVHFSPLPTDPVAPDGSQCWVRVLFRQGTAPPTEIAKYVWPANDLHGVVHPLAFPVGLEADPNTVLRLNVGSTFGGGAACPIEIKVYTRKN